MTGGSADEIADYAGRLYDYHRQHPDSPACSSGKR